MRINAIELNFAHTADGDCQALRKIGETRYITRVEELSNPMHYIQVDRYSPGTWNDGYYLWLDRIDGDLSLLKIAGFSDLLASVCKRCIEQGVQLIILSPFGDIDASLPHEDPNID